MSYSSSVVVTPEFLAETRVPQYLAGCIAPLAITTLFILARIYSRAIILRIWGIDDTFITVSWIGSVVLTILDCEVVKYGAGRHIQTLTVDDVKPQDILSYTVRLIYQLVLSGTKLGICFFYLRVFTERKSKQLIHALMVFIVLFTIPLLLVQIFQCQPVTDFWKLGDQNCPVNELSVVYATGICNIFSDVLLLVFVVPRVWNLRMALRQKVALMAILSTSLLVIIASIIRTQLVAKLANSTDPSWDDVVIALWSVIEVNTGLFCVSIAAIKPLVRKAFPSLLSSAGQSSNTRTRGGTTGGYGLGTKVHNRSQAFELESVHENDTTFGAKVSVTNKFWAGKKGDGESETNVLDQSRKIDITKTVDVKFETRNTFLDADQSSDGSMKRFEHV